MHIKYRISFDTITGYHQIATPVNMLQIIQCLFCVEPASVWRKRPPDICRDLYKTKVAVGIKRHGIVQPTGVYGHWD